MQAYPRTFKNQRYIHRKLQIGKRILSQIGKHIVGRWEDETKKRFQIYRQERQTKAIQSRSENCAKEDDSWPDNLIPIFTLLHILERWKDERKRGSKDIDKKGRTKAIHAKSENCARKEDSWPDNLIPIFTLLHILERWKDERKRGSKDIDNKGRTKAIHAKSANCGWFTKSTPNCGWYTESSPAKISIRKAEQKQFMPRVRTVAGLSSPRLIAGCIPSSSLLRYR